MEEILTHEQQFPVFDNNAKATAIFFVFEEAFKSNLHSTMSELFVSIIEKENLEEQFQMDR